MANMAPESSYKTPIAEVGAIVFVAIGLVKDCSIIARCSYFDREEFEEKTTAMFQKLLAAASSNLMAGERTQLSWEESSVHLLLDEDKTVLYCAITSSSTYPEQLAVQLLYDLMEACRRSQRARSGAGVQLIQDLDSQVRRVVAQYRDGDRTPMRQPSSEGEPLAVPIPLRLLGSLEMESTEPSSIPSLPPELLKKWQKLKLKLCFCAVATLVMLLTVVFWALKRRWSGLALHKS